MFRVEREEMTVEIPDTDPRWHRLTKDEQLAFIDGRFAGGTDEEVFTALGFPAPAAAAPADTPDEEGGEE